MRLIQTFLPALRKAPGQGARIVKISSIAGLISGPGWAVNLWVGEVLEKSPQPTRDGYREVSLMAAPLDCRGGATADARRHASCAAPQTTRLQSCISTQVYDYSETKHAVEAMSAALRQELAPFDTSLSRPSTLGSCARRSCTTPRKTTSSPRTLPRSV